MQHPDEVEIHHNSGEKTELDRKAASPSASASNNLLDSFAALPVGWDSYGGLPVKPRAIEKAKELLAVLPAGNWQVVPGSGGDVQLELSEGGFDIEILIEAI